MHTTINFMYFANNFSQSQLQSVFDSTDCSEHLKSKFKSYSDKFNGNGTQMFFHWFMMLDNENKMAVINWIENNYSNK
jgi:hypothetical protein